jgi:hypothetical protein
LKVYVVIDYKFIGTVSPTLFNGRHVWSSELSENSYGRNAINPIELGQYGSRGNRGFVEKNIGD